MTFGSDDNLVGSRSPGFSLPTAQALFNSRGYYDTISVLAAPGADNVKLQRAIAAILPPGVEVVSGQALVNELSSAVDSELSFISTALLIFGFISLFVGAFTIFNTFSITVGQRTRELALLRVVGASRRQVFRSVLGEAAVTGFVASLIGLGLGVLAALGLKALLEGVRRRPALVPAGVRGSHAGRRDRRRGRRDRGLGDPPGPARGADPTCGRAGRAHRRRGARHCGGGG